MLSCCFDSLIVLTNCKCIGKDSEAYRKRFGSYEIEKFTNGLLFEKEYAQRGVVGPHFICVPNEQDKDTRMPPTSKQWHLIDFNLSSTVWPEGCFSYFHHMGHQVSD